MLAPKTGIVGETVQAEAIPVLERVLARVSDRLAEEQNAPQLARAAHAASIPARR